MISFFNKFFKHPLTIVIILVIAAYLNMLRNQPVFDDHFFIEGEFESSLTIGNLVKSDYPMPETGVYRPARNIFYAILIPVFGSNPTPYHIFTLALHLVSTILIFQIIHKLSKNKKTAIIASLLFGLHPIHVESVSWITAGFDLIFVNFYLASIYTYIHQSSIKKLSIFFAIFAYFSNEAAITLPVILFFYEYLFNSKFSWKKSAEKITPFIIGAVIYWLIRDGILTKTIETSSIYQDGWDKYILPIYIFGLYISQLLFPLILSTDHFFFPGMTGLYNLNHNPETNPPHLLLTNPNVAIPLLLSIIFITTTIILVIKRKKISLPLIFTLASLLPVISVVSLPILFTERYAYLASAGFIAIFAMAITKLMSSKKTRLISIIFIGAISTSYFYQVVDRNKDWRNDFTLWESTLNHNPDSVLALNSLGTAYQRSGDDKKALFYYEQSIQKNPHITKHQTNLSSTYTRLEMHQENIDFLSFLLTRYPNKIQLIFSIGNSYEELGDYQNATNYYLKASKLSPNHLEITKALNRVSPDKY